ncbi:protein SOGA3-like isoform X1 [Passer montanus]|uniref:protein SOGA3-like isoform X1 n=1 Tax=Passer montanus TaxID=9160 RepID=UPI001960DC3C|nr:protein SOGA3-like isoform X1 [Passer montanus]
MWESLLLLGLQEGIPNRTSDAPREGFAGRSGRAMENGHLRPGGHGTGRNVLPSAFQERSDRLRASGKVTGLGAAWVRLAQRCRRRKPQEPGGTPHAAHPSVCLPACVRALHGRRQRGSPRPASGTTAPSGPRAHPAPAHVVPGAEAAPCSLSANPAATGLRLPAAPAHIPRLRKRSRPGRTPPLSPSVGGWGKGASGRRRRREGGES